MNMTYNDQYCQYSDNLVPKYIPMIVKINIWISVSNFNSIAIYRNDIEVFKLNTSTYIRMHNNVLINVTDSYIISSIFHKNTSTILYSIKSIKL